MKLIEGQLGDLESSYYKMYRDSAKRWEKKSFFRENQKYTRSCRYKSSQIIGQDKIMKKSFRVIITNMLSEFRRIVCRILGMPYPLSYVIYKSDFPSGKLIGKPSQIGAFTLIDFGGGVRIGENVKIGYGVIILSVSTITGSKGKEIIMKPVTIGNDVEIGSNSVILPGVTIGDSSTIGAGTVVLKDIPPNTIATGIPARAIGKRDVNKKSFT